MTWSRAIRLCLALASVFAVVVAARAASRGGTTQAPQSCRQGNAVLHFSVDGEPHEALVDIPRGASRRLPLVLAFHGARYGARFASRYYRLTPLADRAHFVVIYPQASHDVFWQLRSTQHEDVEAVRALLDRVEQWPCIDSARVYATGVSNGGGFTARLGCELADRLAAIAPVAGGYGSLGTCRPTRAVPVLEIHGTEDPIVPYRGTGPDGDGSVPGFLAQWVALDDCRGAPRRTVLSRDVTRLAWTRCAGGASVEHLRLGETGHVWPGGDSDTDRHDPTGVDAAETVWRFLSRFRLPVGQPAAPGATR
jgi:polyhydroxybutyrate depolymerase